MNSENTPRIGDVLKNNQIKYMPEAHRYLKVGDKRFDYTTPSSSFKNIEDVILTEIVIQPDQVNKFKVEYHQEFIKH
jgi:hypothetical protein